MLNRRESWILSIKTFVHCKCNIKIDLDFYVRVCTFLQKMCNWKTALSDNCVNCTETFLFKILRKNYIKDNWKILCVSLLPNQWLDFKLLKMQTRTKKCWSGQLCLLYYQWLHHQVLILKLWGEAVGICLSPIQVSCIAGFSWPPWQSSCNKSNGNAQTASLSIIWQKQFWFHYSCYSFNKNNKTTKNLVPPSWGRFFVRGECACCAFVGM